MADQNDQYSLLIGLIYLFNLLLGTGVLTMPIVFNQAGYLSGFICLTLLCLISYIQTTFLIESMANANFVRKMQRNVWDRMYSINNDYDDAHHSDFNVR
ncbi:hypothetical protein QR98_0079700 [Sarcoptes scabiei]|uniref:Uncharacterized protein n=1 Tax=Sarcoptes scabiei TaxID=52283 RepID=A0A132AEM4_SARSC|nr:hypothetical protein QR98_0079700 [Sarcoptes scabiei]